MAYKSVFINSGFEHSNTNEFFAYGGLFLAPIQRVSVDSLDEYEVKGKYNVDALDEYVVTPWTFNVDALDEYAIHVGYFNADALDEYEITGNPKSVDALDEYIIDALYRPWSYTSIPPGIRRGYRSRGNKHSRTFRIKRGFINK